MVPLTACTRQARWPISRIQKLLPIRYCPNLIDNRDCVLVLLLLDNTSVTPKTVKWLRERSARAVCSVLPHSQHTARSHFLVVRQSEFLFLRLISLLRTPMGSR